MYTYRNDYEVVYGLYHGLVLVYVLVLVMLSKTWSGDSDLGLLCARYDGYTSLIADSRITDKFVFFWMGKGYVDKQKSFERCISAGKRAIVMVQKFFERSLRMRLMAGILLRPTGLRPYPSNVTVKCNCLCFEETGVVFRISPSFHAIKALCSAQKVPCKRLSTKSTDCSWRHALARPSS